MAVQAREKYLDLFCPRVPEGLRVVADEARLRQVLVNVIGNRSVHAAGDGHDRDRGARGVPFVEVWVRDTGIGVDEEKLARLFQSSRRATRPPRASTVEQGWGW